MNVNPFLDYSGKSDDAKVDELVNMMDNGSSTVETTFPSLTFDLATAVNLPSSLSNVNVNPFLDYSGKSDDAKVDALVNMMDDGSSIVRTTFPLLTAIDCSRCSKSSVKPLKCECESFSRLLQ